MNLASNNEFVEATLLHYTREGKKLSHPRSLVGQVVIDEEHGAVLEIVLPSLRHSFGEHAILIGVRDLRRLTGICLS